MAYRTFNCRRLDFQRAEKEAVDLGEKEKVVSHFLPQLLVHLRDNLIDYSNFKWIQTGISMVSVNPTIGPQRVRIFVLPFRLKRIRKMEKETGTV